MFDLFRSRQKAVRYMLIGLLSVVALSMVTYLIPGFGSPTTKTVGDEATIAEVGNLKVTAQEVVTAMSRIMQRGQLPPEMIEAYVPQVVSGMVDERAIEYEFTRLGLTVSDDEVLVGLETDNPTYFKEGVLVSKDEFEQRLAQQGMTLQDVVDAMRRRLMSRKVENIVYATILVPDSEVEQEYKRQKERVTIQYIVFPPAKFRDDVKLTPDEVHKMFESHHAEYFEPEKRSFQVLIVDQAKLEQAMTIPDADLHATYSASMDNFRIPERVKARHILIKADEKASAAEKKQALAKAEDILKQLKAGADFTQLAQKNSDDTSNAPKGGDLGFFVRGQMVPEFDTAAFALKPGQLSGIVTTKFGYHILRVDEREAARVKPFEEVKEQLATELKKQRVTELMQKTADDVHDALVKSPGSAAEVAKKFGVELATVTDAHAGAPVPTLGSVPEIDNALAQMKPNDVTPVLTLPANRLVVAVLTKRIPSRGSTFEEAESKVRDRLISLKSMTVAKDKAREAAAKIRAGEDMAKVAKEYKLELASPPAFGRADSVEGLGAANSIKEVFKSPVGAILGPTDAGNKDVVYKLTAKVDADMAGFAAEKDTIRETLRQERAKERLDLFMDSVKTRLTAEKKLKVNDDLLKKLAAAMKRS
jgi:peptidyl-prolyl cis-trans isomerase D